MGLEGIRELAELVTKTLGTTEPMTVALVEVLLEYAELFDKKQHDYGSANIAKFGEFGAVVRASDKVERLTNLWGKGTIAVGETLDDTWQDLLGYAAIGLLLRRGRWDV